MFDRMKLVLKRIAFTASVALLGGILFTSCERCIQCSRSIQSNDATSFEFCSSSKQELDNYESNWQKNSSGIIGVQDSKCFEVY